MSFPENSEVAMQVSEILKRMKEERDRLEDGMRKAEDIIEDLRERLNNANVQKNKLISLYKSSVKKHHEVMEEKDEVIRKYAATINDLTNEVEQLKKKMEKSSRNKLETPLQHPVFETPQTQSVGKIVKSKLCNNSRFSTLDIAQGSQKKARKRIKKKLYKDDDSVANLETEN